MRKLFISLIVLVFAIVLVGCGNADTSDNGEISLAETTQPETTLGNEYIAYEEYQNEIDAEYADWIDLGVMSIPSTWHFSFADGRPLPIDMFGEGVGGSIRMSVWDIVWDDPYMIIDDFSSQLAFTFDDGHIGYMLQEHLFDFDPQIIWLHTDLMIGLSLHFDENDYVFVENEELILRIARTIGRVIIDLPAQSYADYYIELFMPIIDALAMLEESGYETSDEDFIRASLSAIQLEWGSPITIAESLFDIQRWIVNNFDSDESPQLVYALHDIGQWGGAPSLFIGVKSNESIEIVAIYVIETSQLDSAAELERGVRFVFSSQGNDETTLTTAIEGHSVITSTRRDDNGEMMEYFQILGPGIGVGWLDFIVTTYPQQRYRVCYIGPCDFCDDGFTRITEEEYLEVIHRFGTSGYDVETVIEARHVVLNWMQVSFSTNRSAVPQS